MRRQRGDRAGRFSRASKIASAGGGGGGSDLAANIAALPARTTAPTYRHDGQSRSNSNTSNPYTLTGLTAGDIALTMHFKDNNGSAPTFNSLTNGSGVQSLSVENPTYAKYSTTCIGWQTCAGTTAPFTSSWSGSFSNDSNYMATVAYDGSTVSGDPTLLAFNSISVGYDSVAVDGFNWGEFTSDTVSSPAIFQLPDFTVPAGYIFCLQTVRSLQQSTGRLETSLGTKTAYQTSLDGSDATQAFYDIPAGDSTSPRFWQSTQDAFWDRQGYLALWAIPGTA